MAAFKNHPVSLLMVLIAAWRFTYFRFVSGNLSYYDELLSVLVDGPNLEPAKSFSANRFYVECARSRWLEIAQIDLC
jgi:hypothetical protein